ncbi:hypothetical protein HZH68_002551 [Vespula germanica]|uniref:Uncharacterized protein n=2 Tax=Vespula TaxID=7451 RepID=A0A834NMI9_VESGE|nr:hypothetical protein HZH68_002551 [Vespula germanica]KAF7434862.1 hypothetical protein H0235_003053 [Vespula pensylvanica]
MGVGWRSTAGGEVPPPLAAIPKGGCWQCWQCRQCRRSTSTATGVGGGEGSPASAAAAAAAATATTAAAAAAAATAPTAEHRFVCSRNELPPPVVPPTFTYLLLCPLLPSLSRQPPPSGNPQRYAKLIQGSSILIYQRLTIVSGDTFSRAKMRHYDVIMAIRLTKSFLGPRNLGSGF